MGQVTCIMKSEVQANFNLENLKESYYFGDLHVYGRLKYFLKKQTERGWIGFNYFRIGSNDKLS